MLADTRPPAQASGPFAGSRGLAESVGRRIVASIRVKSKPRYHTTTRCRDPDTKPVVCRRIRTPVQPTPNIDSTHEGLAAARARGTRLGRPPAMTPDQVRSARTLLAEPDHSVTSVAKLLGVSRSTTDRATASGPTIVDGHATAKAVAGIVSQTARGQYAALAPGSR